MDLNLVEEYETGGLLLVHCCTLELRILFFLKAAAQIIFDVKHEVQQGLMASCCNSLDTH